MPTPFSRRLPGLLGALVLGSVSAPAALAQDAPRAPSTMVVLDSSGSMINNDAGGQTRIDAAKDAARTFIDEVGGSADLGLVTYGGNTGETDADRAAGCRDITLVTPPGDDTAEDMLNHIDALEPRGYTPIGDSLIEAADALPSQGGTIVLVSDGIDTCAPPPVCEVAADLADRGVDIIINTVGFNVDAAARAELQCIADAAGGTYADASDADTLAEELKKATTRTYRAYESDLERIDGGASESEAAEVSRGVKEFSTALPAAADDDTESVVHFTTPVTEGERVIVSATTTQAPSINNWEAGSFILNVRAEERACQLDTDTIGEIAVSNYQTTTLFSHVIGEGCDVDDLGFHLTRQGGWNAGEEVNVDVTVTRLGVPDMEGQPAPVAETSDPPQVSGTGEGTEVTPGTWFADAAELTPGETVRVDIVPGETHFYRLPVEHGQRLVGAVTPVEESEDFSGMGPGENLKVTAYNEAGAIVPLSNGTARILADRTTDFGYEAPVLFANRYGGTDEEGSADRDVRRIWLDGQQFLSVRYDRLFSREDIDAQSQLPVLTYTLVADAVGDPVPGPTFTPVNATTTSEPPTSEAAPAPETESAAADSDSDSGGMGLWLGFGAVVLVLLGAGGFALSRRS
ncbi:MAG: VWA domain-containing protein [Corynebacterium sp.]|uniref:vWA domain-containing protein n=1 Tax=Corynebacterium sp. TaxID=1720 RepID=UPI0026E0301A|nr:VWA domain-containing protein [Corynebacterium sp.]MDO5668573.1 VWA domain-containing protein [Corynebacterium sp.]